MVRRLIDSLVGKTRASAEAAAKDPKHDDAVAQLATALTHELTQQRGRLDLDSLRDQWKVRTFLLQEAAFLCYRRFAERAWADGRISDTERSQLALIRSALKLSLDDASGIELDIAGPVFIQLVHDALADGHLDTSEKKQLSTLASGLRMTAPELIQRLMRDDAALLLRRAFEPDFSCPLDDQIESLRTVRSLAAELGFGEADLGRILALEAQEIVEFALASAGADLECELEAEKLLDLLSETPGLSGSQREALQNRIRSNLLRSQLANGTARLPTTHPDWLFAKPGEIWHLDAKVRRRKFQKRGPDVLYEDTIGRCAVSGLRLSFMPSNDARIVDLTLRNVKAARPLSDRSISITTARGTAEFHFASERHVLVLAELIRRAQGGGPNTTEERRRISKDVRQLVWTRDQGQCVQCGATDYLEYDHLIPVSKGGSNSAKNIQLLCRRCNGEKSDSI